jgi:hypothetical protein
VDAAMPGGLRWQSLVRAALVHRVARFHLNDIFTR